jgi:TonB family protein
VIQLTATVGTDGRVHNIQLVSGNTNLAGAAFEALPFWRYVPAQVDGEFVESPISYTFNFVAPQREKTSVEAQLIHKVQPSYPSWAKQAHIEGEVQLTATVDTNGSVYNIRVVSGNPILARASIQAVQSWRYIPAQTDGVSVESTVEIKLNFTLHE